MSTPVAGKPSANAHVFPPALAPLLREECAARCPCLAALNDEMLVQLLTTVFFAGVETYEGAHNPTGIVFLGSTVVDVVLPEMEAGAAPHYQWKVNRFAAPRPFAIPELVKLSVAGTHRRIYSAVHALDGQLTITGLAREGLSAGPDPFLKIIAARPGCLSVRNGRDLLFGYERGSILTGGEDAVFAAGPVRRVLEATARAAGMGDDGVVDYLDAVGALVREMAAHGRGGILIVTPEEQPVVTESATYRMALDSSLGSLLRLARLIGKRNDVSASTLSFGQVLRNAFLSEVERAIEELGALTGIDGATLLDRNLGLVAFGVILPVGKPAAAMQATDVEGLQLRPIDLGDRGTRHRASATYATEHPASVVFVAAEDGQVTCMMRPPSQEQVLLWRLSPADVGVA